MPTKTTTPAKPEAKKAAPAAKTAENKKTATATKPVEAKKTAPAAKPEAKKAEPAKAAAPMKKYHISLRKEDGKWQVKAEGAEKALKLFDTQEQAIAYAKVVASNQEGVFYIHKKDGSFRKLTY